MSSTALACPAPDGPNWELAKSLYIAGLSIADIIIQCNVPDAGLRKRIVREKWVQLRTDTTSLQSLNHKQITQVTAQTTVGDESLQNSSNNVRNTIGKRLEQQVTAMTGKEVPKSLKAIKAEQDVLESVVRNGRVVFGWDAQSATTMISVTNLESARPPTPVTDVSAVVVPEQSMLSDSPEQGKAG